MTEFIALYLVVSAIYLFDCVIWVREGTVLFLRSWSKWHISKSSMHFGALSRHACLGRVLPPLTGAVLTRTWCFEVSPEGVQSLRDQPIFISFEELKSIRADGTRVLCNDKLLAAVDSEVHALRLAQFIQCLKSLEPARRQQAILKEFSKNLNVGTAKRRITRLLLASCRMRWECNALFVTLFVGSPVIVWRLGLLSAWLPLVLLIFLLVADITRRFAHLHSVFYPRQTALRRKAAVTMLLSPMAALRAVDALFRDIVVNFDPLAVVEILLEQSERQRVREKLLREAFFPLCESIPEMPHGDAHNWFVGEWRNYLERFVTGQTSDLGRILECPDKQADDCMVYCPRCLAQFTQAVDTCPDCGRSPLQEFPRGETAALSV